MSQTSEEQATPEEANFVGESYTWSAGTNTLEPNEVQPVVAEAAPVVDEVIPETPETVAEVIEEVQTIEEEAPADTVETEEVTQEEEAPAEEPFVTDDFYKSEAYTMKERGEIAEDFDIENATPDSIREAWRANNLGKIAEEAQNVAIENVRAELVRSYTPEMLEISRRLSNGVHEDAVDDLLAYKEASEVEVSKLERDELHSYVKDYLIDKGLDEDVADSTIGGAEEKGIIDDLAAKAKTHFSNTFQAKNTATKETADRVEAQKRQTDLNNQQFIKGIFQTGKINEEEMTQAQLLQLQKGLYEQNVPVQAGNGQTVNLSQFEVFEKQLENNYPLRVYLYKTLLHKGDSNTAQREKIKAEVESSIEKRWGTTRVVKGTEPEKNTKKKGTAAEEVGESYTINADGLSRRTL